MKIDQKESMGSRIKRIRKKLGIGQAEFAKMVEISGKSAVSKYELDQRGAEIPTLIKISKVGNKSLDWLLVDRPPPKEKKVDKKLRDIIAQVERIFREGDSKKLSTILTMLNLMDPGKTRDRKDNQKK